MTELELTGKSGTWGNSPWQRFLAPRQPSVGSYTELQVCGHPGVRRGRKGAAAGCIIVSLVGFGTKCQGISPLTVSKKSVILANR